MVQSARPSAHGSGLYWTPPSLLEGLVAAVGALVSTTKVRVADDVAASVVWVALLAEYERTTCNMSCVAVTCAA